MSKGRKAPPAPIDHAAALAERLGRGAYESAQQQSILGYGLSWAELETIEQAAWCNIGQAVLHAVTRRGARRGDLEVVSSFGMATQQPYVELWVDTSPAQMTPAKAREIALMLLEGADASESDATLIGFAQGALGMDIAGPARLVDQLRQYRAQTRGKAVDSA